MSETLTMVPLGKIKTRPGFNPRSEFADEQMAELVESVKRHGIITPLTLAPEGDRFTIIAGERRYRAAKAAKLKEVPAQVRDAHGEALTLAVAENVIRADLTAAWLAEHSAGAAWFPSAPGEVVDDVLAADWQDDDGKPLHPVAYSVGGWYGPILPGSRGDVMPTLLVKLGPHAEPVEAAL